MPFLSPPLNVFLCNASGIALSSLSATASVRHRLSSNVWNALDSNLLVDSSALTSLFPLHQAETESEGLRGCVNPVPTLDDVLHSLTALMSPLPGTVFPTAEHVLLPAFLHDTFFKYPQNSSPPKRIWFAFCEIKNVTLSLVIETFLELMVSLITKVTIQLKLVCIDSTLIYFGCEGNLHIFCCFSWSPRRQKLSPPFFIFIFCFCGRRSFPLPFRFFQLVQ